ncbi:shikimate dehydrogenase [Nostocoides vanveenii]|uniref:Shikimate dehydrogenase (NADP(+)) n=1 Tax=Nostocoides vanveenii TaxID=330835 RepID=A0ABN2JYW4_9MICO
MPRTYLGIITGSFSTPAADNPTVVAMEAAYRHHGLDARYLNCDIGSEELAAAVSGARAMGWAGFNCSIPHKRTVIDLIDALAPSAEIIGAVNCVVATDDGLIGHNTDGQGFVAALTQVRTPEGAHIVVLGTGGAARAVAVETALAGAASITLVGREADEASTLGAYVTQATGVPAYAKGWEGAYAVPPTADILVNATSVGFGDPDAMVDIDVASLRPGLIAADVVVSATPTAYVRAARAAGATALDGVGMMVGQAAVNFHLWTGVEPDRDVMRAALEATLAG